MMTVFWGTLSEAVSDAQFMAQCDESQAMKLVQYDAYMRRWYVHHEPVDDVEWRGDLDDYAARLNDVVDHNLLAFFFHVAREVDRA